MSMTSKVNSGLRTAIIKSLTIVPGKTNEGLFLSGVANGGKFSLRAIQEATQKLTKDGTLYSSRPNGRTLYYNRTPELVADRPQAFSTTAAS